MDSPGEKTTLDLKLNMEKQKCLTYRKKSEKITLEIDRQIKICKKIFDHPYMYDTAMVENSVCRRIAKKFWSSSRKNPIAKNKLNNQIFSIFFQQNLLFESYSHVMMTLIMEPLSIIDTV